MRHQQLTTLLLLFSLSAVLGIAAWDSGGTDFAGWNSCLILLGVTGLAYWLRVPGNQCGPPLRRKLLVALTILFGYVLLQLLPLPIALLDVITPSRALLTRATSPTDPPFSPISIMPARTVAYLLRLTAFVLLYILVREAGWRWRNRASLVAMPLLALGLIEAFRGFGQLANGAPFPVGTYLNRDHYGCLTAMLIPFPALFTLCALARRNWWSTGAAGLLTLLLAIALTRSQSRMAVASCAGGIAVAAIVYARSGGYRNGRTRIRAGLAAAAGAVILLLLLAPAGLMSRFADLRNEGRWDANRLPIWQETIGVIKAYPVTGCGLGCFKSAYLAQKANNVEASTDYSHNEYLQAVAEMGLPGFLAALAAGAFLCWDVLQAARTRLLSLACLASIATLALHGFADFNLHQPATMLLLAWVCGLGSVAATMSTSRESL